MKLKVGGHHRFLRVDGLPLVLEVRGRSAIAKVFIDALLDGSSYVGAPQLVLQSGRLALIISDAATSVARRSLDGWHYVISRFDL